MNRQLVAALTWRGLRKVQARGALRLGGLATEITTLLQVGQDAGLAGMPA
jgi:hypothetical protein